ncbi:hypothetical protein ACIRSU_11850 [Streptomyces sp. NPDC101160]|uniref:hypothetical protein n=1 Tax=Streptomyces sp. NPDC101160 TaxID=3366118 RepID=UPI0038220236
MATADKKDRQRQSDDTPQVDEATRERSSRQRNITSPTPPDVRAKADEDDDDRRGSRAAEGRRAP